ncbi:MAG TPA: hypothetical protein VNM66_06950 [Thermodesulfobacteriota bacterium]|nr:hypothetical protein [Thermodesulfobacteriota bacterium]
MIPLAELIDPVVVRHAVTLPTGERVDEVLVEGAVLDSYECTFRFMLDEGCLPDKSMTSACCYRGCIVTPAELARYERDLDAILASGALDELAAGLVRDARAAGRLAHDVRACEPHCAPDEPETAYLEETLRLKGDDSAARGGYRCTFTHRPDGDGCLFRTRALVEFRGRRVPLNLCGLHAYALKAGIDPYEYKPTDCELWPLYLVRTAEGPLALVSQPAHLRHANMNLHCVTNPLPPVATGERAAGVPMFETMPHVRRYFGEGFLEALRAARRERDQRRQRAGVGG